MKKASCNKTNLHKHNNNLLFLPGFSTLSIKLKTETWQITCSLAQSTPINHISLSFFVSVSLSFSPCHSNSRRKEQLSNDVSTQRGGLNVRQRAITNALISIILCWRTVSSLAATGWISPSCVQLMSGAFCTWTNGFLFRSSAIHLSFVTRFLFTQRRIKQIIGGDN